MSFSESIIETGRNGDMRSLSETSFEQFSMLIVMNSGFQSAGGKTAAAQNTFQGDDTQP
jgi:hypothetical protein